MKEINYLKMLRPIGLGEKEETGKKYNLMMKMMMTRTVPKK